MIQSYLGRGLSPEGVSFDRHTVNHGGKSDQYELENAPLGIKLRFTVVPYPKSPLAYDKKPSSASGGEQQLPLDIHVQNINLADKDLYGQGFGTELLRLAILKVHTDHPAPEGAPPQPAILSTSPANLIKLNTIAKLAGGPEKVSARMEGRDYGYGHRRPLSQAIKDFPYDGTARYLFADVEAHINPEELLRREPDYSTSHTN